MQTTSLADQLQAENLRWRGYGPLLGSKAPAGKLIHRLRAPSKAAKRRPARSTAP
ncbi:MAG: hypothetical protein ACXWZW_10290 [Solirubrobacterales bacterium]